MTGRHAKRTTVKRVEGGWRVDLATFDRRSASIFWDTNPNAFELAVNLAQSFEASKARARFIEANRRPFTVDVAAQSAQDHADALDFWAGRGYRPMPYLTRSMSAPRLFSNIRPPMDGVG